MLEANWPAACSWLTPVACRWGALLARDMYVCMYVCTSWLGNASAGGAHAFYGVASLAHGSGKTDYHVVGGVPALHLAGAVGNVEHEQHSHWASCGWPSGNFKRRPASSDEDS